MDTSLNPSESASWPRVLLDRFQTDFAKYDPAYRAEVLFNDTSCSLELGLFSTADRSFYSHPVDVIATIEKKAGLVSNIQYVKNGFNNYIPDLEHSRVFSNDDFDHKSALEQWLSQKPIGRQTIVQFDVKQEVLYFAPLSATLVKDAFQGALLSMNYNGMDIADVRRRRWMRHCSPVVHGEHRCGMGRKSSLRHKPFHQRPIGRT